MSRVILLRTFAPLTALLFTLAFAVSPAASQSAAAWNALKSGKAVAIMRHAKAPHPRGAKRTNKGVRMVNLWTCAGQRNLSAAGRAQAQRIGAHLRRRGIGSARIISSAYCRTKDTASLLGLGGVSTDYTLNALSKPSARQQTAGFRALIRSAPAGMPTILVTHKTNIRALTGVTPSSGETLIVNRRGRVIGRFKR
ncbi:MAG: histidine phosphatase family protein [Pseudomonadota bacterium]